MQLNCIKEMTYHTSRLANSIDFKSETVLENEVSNANRIGFERDIQKLLLFGNELQFITKDKNKEYADECFKSVQRMFAKGTGVIRKGLTNQDFKDVLHSETRQILDYLYLIQNNEEDFKDFVFKEYFVFDKELFKPLVDKIVLNRKETRDNFYLFDEELHGGEFLHEAKETLAAKHPTVENFHLYGIDRDIDLGKNSRDLGINTARKSLLASSDYWADILFSANDFIALQDENMLNNYTKVAYNITRRRKVHKKSGIMVFNIPFYKMESFSNTLNSHVIDGIYRTDDEAGNMIIVMRFDLKKDIGNAMLVRKAIFQPQSFPTVFEASPIFVDSKEDEGPKTYRAGFIDLDDVASQFIGLPSVSDFIFEYLEPENNDEDTRRALQEPKEGHIPTLATSGIVSGRYVDEVLSKRYNKKIGFDNLIETKIVKRDIEEEQMVMVKGEMVKEVSQKKSNIIVSTTLTASGEYIELFSNDSDSDK